MIISHFYLIHIFLIVPTEVGKKTGNVADSRLSVPFYPVVRFAEHLAVVFAGRTSLAPCGHVVGVHLAHLVNPLLVQSLALGAQRTVGDSLSFGLFRTNCLIFWGYI